MLEEEKKFFKNNNISDLGGYGCTRDRVEQLYDQDLDKVSSKRDAVDPYRNFAVCRRGDFNCHNFVISQGQKLSRKAISVSVNQVIECLLCPRRESRNWL